MFSKKIKELGMYINGDFRSRTKKKKKPWNHNIQKGSEIWDLMKPILPWLGFVQIDGNFIRENFDKLTLWLVHTIFS